MGRTHQAGAQQLDTSFFQQLPATELRVLVDKIRVVYKLPSDELVRILNHNKDVSEPGAYLNIPISIFDNDELSCLESIAKYLKEEMNIRFSEMGALLNRDERTLWSAYHNASKKMKTRFPPKESSFFIPTFLFRERTLSILETICLYLKDQHRLKNRDIARLLNRDQRTIWTVCHRGENKSK